MKSFLLFLCILNMLTCAAQTPGYSLLHEPWNAFWITVPEESPQAFGVYLFRKSVQLVNKPDSFIVHVSADNRYKLFINGTQVSLGPARSDIAHWNYETIDIAPFLKPGKNWIAAQVWNEGEWRAEGQISYRTGFILQGSGSNEAIVNTDMSWKCIRDSSFAPLPFKTTTYYVAGPGETTNMNLFASGWNQPEYDDEQWRSAIQIMPGIPKGLVGGYGTISGWQLSPSIIPQMELKDQRFARIRETKNMVADSGFLKGRNTVTVLPNTEAIILMDQGFLTNAYPEMIFSGGAGATASVGYAESLYTNYPSKDNRNETEGKVFLGRKDSIISSGLNEQFFTTLTYRTFRYVQLTIHTRDEPLVIKNLQSKSTGYPFQLKAKLISTDSQINKILEVGWRTARMCAMETYMDCPYYEQLQYIGDARIQAMISLYNSGDERLLIQALNAMDNSRQPEGITLSRHPSFTPQYIPPFSLWYIGMLHDYMMYGKDSSVLVKKLPGERQILNYFRNYQSGDGSLHGMPFWLFSDWVEAPGWQSGRAPVGKDGSSSVLDFQLLWAYQLCADQEEKFGMKAFSALYRNYADQLKTTIRNKYWDANRKLFADRPERDLFSQHANILAILTGMFETQEAKAVGKKLLSDTGMAQASIYFKYYLHQALIRAGMGDDYLNWLQQWRDNILSGMTTWAEISDINNARSDCHAWGASPNIEFFRTVLGMDSDAPGFKKIKIEPHLGTIKNISGEMPHPNGKIFVAYHLDNAIWNIQIGLPAGTSGSFVWKEKIYVLKPGQNIFSIPS